MPDPSLPLDHMSDRAKEVLADHHILGSQIDEPAPNFTGETILVEVVLDDENSFDLGEALGGPVIIPINVGLSALGLSFELSIDEDTITLASLSFEQGLITQIEGFHFQD